MYDSFAASCDQPIHLINIISISSLAMNLPKKKMSLHLYICTQCCQAWHIHLQFNNIVITRYAVGPAIDVARRNCGVNHLHESGRSLDYSSDSSFSHCLRCIVVPVVGSHSICAGLTRSKETVSTLPLTRIFITLPLLATTLYGPS